MKGLPIEPGCLAMIVAPYYEPGRGLIVKVIERVAGPGPVPIPGTGQYWFLNGMSVWWVERKGGVPICGMPNQSPCIVGESYLRRIDGPEEITEETLDLSKELVLTP